MIQIQTATSRISGQAGAAVEAGEANVEAAVAVVEQEEEGQRISHLKNGPL